MSASEFRRKLETLINVENREGGSNTPDFILADYLVTCLEAFDKAAMRRDDWYGVELRPGMRSAVGGATAGEAKPTECAMCKGAGEVLHFYQRGPGDPLGNQMIPCPVCIQRSGARP